MGKLFYEYLEGNNIYACVTCNTHLSSLNELVSKVLFSQRIHWVLINFKAFKGRGGKAFLFNSV